MNLAHLEVQILQLHNGLNVRPTVETARRIGDLLLSAKAQLPHGEYLPWVARIGLSRQSASAYTQVAKAEVGNDQSSSHLSIDAILKRIRIGRRAERRENAVQLVSSTEGSAPSASVICMNSLKWLGGQETGSIPFIVTDPPYGLGMTFDGWRDPSTPSGYWAWLGPFWSEMTRVVQPGGSVVMWQAFHHLAYLTTWFPDSKVVASCYTIRGVRQWEPIIVWTKPGAKPFVRPIPMNDWIDASQWYRGETGAFKAVHPCPKPLNDCREVVRRYTLPDKLVVDPFCGVGSIPLAAKMEGRPYLGIERSHTYCGLARERLAEVKEPV